jgi:hypothetical protein
MILTKANCWSYEREWRILHIQAGLAYTYPWQTLTAVYFGVAMPPRTSGDHRADPAGFTDSVVSYE